MLSFGILILVLIPYSIFLGWNAITLILFWFILVPLVAHYSSRIIKDVKNNLIPAMGGAFLFYSVMIILTYKQYESDYFTIIKYSVIPSLLIILVINYEKLSFLHDRK